jgi:hypothetical protein
VTSDGMPTSVDRRTPPGGRLRAGAPAALVDLPRARGRLALLCAALVLHGGVVQARPDPEVGASAGLYAVLAGGLGHWRYDCGFLSGCQSAGSTAFKLGVGWRWQVFGLELWGLSYGSTTTSGGTRLQPRAAGLGGAWQWPLSPEVDIVLRTGLVQVDQVRSSGSGGGEGHAAFGLALVGRMTSSLSYEVAWDNTSAVLERFANTYTVGVRAAF